MDFKEVLLDHLGGSLKAEEGAREIGSAQDLEDGGAMWQEWGPQSYERQDLEAASTG